MRFYEAEIALGFGHDDRLRGVHVVLAVEGGAEGNLELSGCMGRNVCDFREYFKSSTGGLVLQSSEGIGRHTPRHLQLVAAVVDQRQVSRVGETQAARAKINIRLLQGAVQPGVHMRNEKLAPLVARNGRKQRQKRAGAVFDPELRQHCDTVVVDAAMVNRELGDIAGNRDLSKYIL